MTAANGILRFYGAYTVVASFSGGFIIQRQDADDRKRTVAFVSSLTQWDRFVWALEQGMGEVGAVHAIDTQAQS